MPAKAKVFKQLSTVLLMQDQSGGLVTTVNALAAAGQKVLLVPNTTGIANGDTVRIGAGELLELGVVASFIAATSITLADNLTYDHQIGDDVVEQNAYDLGDVTDAGATVTGAANTSDVLSAMRRLVYTILNGYVDLGATFSLPGLTLQNLAFALGVPQTNVSGSGAALTPFFYATDGTDFGGSQNNSLIIMGLTQDGTPLRVELWGVDFDYTSFSIQLKRGVLASIPVKVTATGALFTTNASAYVANTTLRAVKGKVLDALQEVGFFADATVGPLATTTTALANAGASVLALTSATNLVANDWLKVGAADTVEFHQIASIAGLNITLKGKLLRAQAAGVAVVREQNVAFGAVSEDGATLACTGTVVPLRIATRRTGIGLKLGSAAMTLSFAVIDYTLANIANAFGVPASAIASGRVPLGSLIGSQTVQGMYVRGITQDGTIVWLTVWGCSQDVSSIAVAMTQQNVPALPVKLKPASGLQLQAA